MALLHQLRIGRSSRNVKDRRNPFSGDSEIKRQRRQRRQRDPEVDQRKNKDVRLNSQEFADILSFG